MEFVEPTLMDVARECVGQQILHLRIRRQQEPGRGDDRSRDQAAAGRASADQRRARRGQGQQTGGDSAVEGQRSRRDRNQPPGWQDRAHVRRSRRVAGWGLARRPERGVE